MEHFYVINGNEYGVCLETKKNLEDIEDANDYFEKIKFDDFVCYLIYVDFNGIEQTIERFINE